MGTRLELTLTRGHRQSIVVPLTAARERFSAAVPVAVKQMYAMVTPRVLWAKSRRETAALT